MHKFFNNQQFPTISADENPIASPNRIKLDEIFDMSSDDDDDHDEDEFYKNYEINSEGGNPMDSPENGQVNEYCIGTAEQMDVVGEIGMDCNGEAQQSLDTKPVLVDGGIFPFSVEADTTSTWPNDFNRLNDF